LSLESVGFELSSSQIARAYLERFPDDPELRDLDYWDDFERDNPGTFAGMYLFWVRDCAERS